MTVRNLGHRLYSGELSYDFVGKRKRWYIVSAVLMLVVVLSIAVRGLNFGIEFTGGAEFQFTATNCTVEQTRELMSEEVGGQVIVMMVGEDQIRVQTEALTPAESSVVSQAIAETCGVDAEDVRIQIVGPSWGSDISKKALQGLIVFLVLVSIFLAIYFEWRMAVAALVALGHDLAITIGVYSMIGFEVTPATLIGVLTILGYSLYDTVVVFDKVKENTKGIASQSRVTYSESANLAVNQTLVRSINTSVVALLPVAAILVVGVGVLGAGTLKDLALALFVGMAAGTYSSIFVATPLLAQIKERDPQMQAVTRRVAARRSQAKAKAESVPIADLDDEDPDGPESVAVARAPRTMVSTGQRMQPKRQSRSKRKGR